MSKFSKPGKNYKEPEKPTVQKTGMQQLEHLLLTDKGFREIWIRLFSCMLKQIGGIETTVPDLVEASGGIAYDFTMRDGKIVVSPKDLIITPRGS